jgi:hypothetical protein
MSFQSDTVDLGIVLFPDAYVTRVALDLAQRLERHSTGLISRVGSETRPPHVTVFQGRFPLGAVSAVRAYMEPVDLHATMSPDELDYRQNGNVFWLVQPNEPLRSLHALFHARLHPLTAGLLMEQSSFIANHLNASVEERAHARRYGSMLAGPHYLPHVTLVRLKYHGDVPVLMHGIALAAAIPVHFHRLALATLYEDGGVDEVIEQIDTAV